MRPSQEFAGTVVPGPEQLPSLRREPPSRWPGANSCNSGQHRPGSWTWIPQTCPACWRESLGPEVVGPGTVVVVSSKRPCVLGIHANSPAGPPPPRARLWSAEALEGQQGAVGWQGAPWSLTSPPPTLLGPDSSSPLPFAACSPPVDVTAVAQAQDVADIFMKGASGSFDIPGPSPVRRHHGTGQTCPIMAERRGTRRAVSWERKNLLGGSGAMNIHDVIGLADSNCVNVINRVKRSGERILQENESTSKVLARPPSPPQDGPAESGSGAKLQPAGGWLPGPPGAAGPRHSLAPPGAGNASQSGREF